MTQIFSRSCRFAFILLSITSLSACVSVPGSNISKSWFVSFYPDEEVEQEVLGDLIDIVPITLDVIVALEDKANMERASQVISNTMIQEIDDYIYYVAKGDVLTITVYDHPELTIPAGSQRTAEEAGNIVHSDGTIFYPFIGEMFVEGLSTETLRSMLADRLSEFVNDPQVDVRVASFRSQWAYVTGQVEKPGTIPITDVPLTVLDAINQAGGLSDSANWHEVRLRHSSNEKVISVYEMLNKGNLSDNRLLHHGDILHIPEIGNQKVFVMGEVNTIQSLDMGNLRYSLSDALAQAGGINQISANASGLFVIRKSEHQDKLATLYQLDVSNAIAYAFATKFILEPEDLVYVTTAPVTRWNRVVNQLLPSLSTLFQFDALTR